MAKDPAVLFYTSDFLSGTLTMTDEHVGMYIRLLCLQHQKGYLTEKDMLYICRSYVEDVYSKFFKTTEGFYVNKRMQDEALRRKKYSESRRKNVSKRYATYVEHMENETINENINKDISISFKEKGVGKDAFLLLWDKYPSKDGKKQALRYFQSSVKSEKDLKDINLALENYLKSKRVQLGFIKNGSTWFNNWRDWINFAEPERQETDAERDARLLKQICTK